mgnify:CR=1 FL=1
MAAITVSDADAPVFVVSSGRCGSTLVSEILESHPDILSLSELLMAANIHAFSKKFLSGVEFWDRFSRPRRAMSDILTPSSCPNEFKYDFSRSNRYSRQTLPPILFMTLPRLSNNPIELFDRLGAYFATRPRAGISKHYYALFSWLRAELGRKIVVERSGGSLMLLKALIRNFKNARFVHLSRDGRDVAASIHHYLPLRLLAMSWNSARNVGVNLLAPPFLFGESRILSWADRNIGQHLDLTRQLHADVPIETIGEFWSTLVIAAESALNELPKDRVHKMKFESLIDNPKAEISELFSFIGAAAVSENDLQLLAEKISPQTRRLEMLSVEQRVNLEQSCAPGLAALGYAT